jgi:hypothetical protein
MKKKYAILMACLLCLAGCKDSTRAQFSALGKRHRVTMYGCDGKAIKVWVSTGNVSNQDRSDGYYFEDEATHLLVEVAGNVVIEVIP